MAGTVNGDVLTYTLATAADATSGVGSYAITVTLGTNANYTVTPSNGTLTVDARAATVTANDKQQDLRRRQSGARCGGDRHGQRRRADLHPGDRGGRSSRASAATRSR